MTNDSSGTDADDRLRDSAPASIRVGLVLIYEYRLQELADVDAFLDACKVLASSIGLHTDHNPEVCWLYGKDPTKPNTIRCFAGFWSLSAQLAFIKSKHWKLFLKTTKALPHQTSVQLVEELRGAVLLHRQMLHRVA